MVVVERIFEGLNDEQAAAVEAVAGPVCILAGAGSGKTTTITRRIANQVATGTFLPGEILAVTFTDKAAREMGSRLAALGVEGVRARTFHAEALAQYRRFSEDRSEIVPSKGQMLAPLVGRLRPPYRFVAVRDVATEIEWAKNRRITPEGYRAALGGHEPPIPEDLMAGIYSTYERTKARAGLMDFEDLVERAIGMLERDPRARNIVRARYRAFTVDEYQDVNLLQQTLLSSWLGDRDEACVVGDDYQSIFGFTGATPRYLLEFGDRFPRCHVVRLVANYRSTPEILQVANRLVPRMGGSAKVLRPVMPGGPEPVFRAHANAGGEIAWILSEMRALQAAGVPWEEMAVLYRINGRSEDLEEALSSAHIPYQVRDGAFLRRPAARATLARLRRAPEGAPVAASVEKVARAIGWRPDAEEEPTDEEATRQADLARLVKLAQEYPGADGIAGFAADLARRFAPEEDGRGAQILTYHRAKGLEFDAVFLPRLEDKELPFALSTSEEDLAEERRLLYVGITRAKRHLFVSWALARPGERRRSPKLSPFLAEIRPARAPAGPVVTMRVPAPAGDLPPEHLEVFLALKEWRLSRSRGDGLPAYVVFNDDTLARIAAARPRDSGELLAISGVGPAKLERYGAEVLRLVRERAAAAG